MKLTHRSLFAVFRLAAGIVFFAHLPTARAQDASRCTLPTITDLSVFNVPAPDQKAVLDALNWARTNPQGVIDYIEKELRPLFTDPKTGKLYERINAEKDPTKPENWIYPRQMSRGEIDARYPEISAERRANTTFTMNTREGVAALDEAVGYLRQLVASKKKLGELKWNAVLAVTAKELADQQAKDGSTGHDRASGIDPFDRAQQIEKSAKSPTALSCAGENCAYGQIDAKSTVVALIIDDGVKGRGHRENIYAPDFTEVGVAVGVQPDRRNPGKTRPFTVMDFGCVAEAVARPQIQIPNGSALQGKSASVREAKPAAPSDGKRQVAGSANR